MTRKLLVLLNIALFAGSMVFLTAGTSQLQPQRFRNAPLAMTHSK